MTTSAGPPPWRSFDNLPRALGGIAGRGRLRERPEDFVVDEVLGFAPDGEGEHALLRIRKTGANTEWVARRLASHAGVRAAAVGFAGLKDRNAVTTQWFTVHLAGIGEPDWEALQVEGVEILEVHRHRRKLRRGVLSANRFAIRVRALAVDDAALDERLGQMRARGVPNYFGAQRFGNADGNLHAAHALFTGATRRVDRHLRGLWLSAARAQIFNEVLAERVENGDWDRPLPGERMQLDGSRSHFLVGAAVDEELIERVRSYDVHPSGPLWGAGEVLTADRVANLEAGVAQRFRIWADGLAAAGLRQERRPLRLCPLGLELVRRADTAEIGFELPAGAYATAVLREIIG